MMKVSKEDRYPFAGYSRLENVVRGAVSGTHPFKGMDTGCRVTLLAKKLYDAGCDSGDMDCFAAA